MHETDSISALWLTVVGPIQEPTCEGALAAMGDVPDLVGAALREEVAELVAAALGEETALGLDEAQPANMRPEQITARRDRPPCIGPQSTTHRAGRCALWLRPNCDRVRRLRPGDSCSS